MEHLLDEAKANRKEPENFKDLLARMDEIIIAHNTNMRHSQTINEVIDGTYGNLKEEKPKDKQMLDVVHPSLVKQFNDRLSQLNMIANETHHNLQKIERTFHNG